jgi:nicotinamide-nucleotide amidase
VEALVAAGETLAVAESLTGGLLASALVAVPGASAVFRGGIIAYATDTKERLLAVEQAVLAANGPVDPTVATQMAMGARWRLDATWAVSTTGVAGPDPQPDDPHSSPVGTVYLGIAGPRIAQAVRLQLDGDREEIRAEASRQALLLLGIALGVVDTVEEEPPSTPPEVGQDPGEAAASGETVPGSPAEGPAPGGGRPAAPAGPAVDLTAGNGALGNNADASRVPHM